MNDKTDEQKFSEKLRQDLLDVIDQIEVGFKYTMRMYIVAFAVGVVLLGSIVVLAFVPEIKSNWYTSAILGSAGIIDVVAFLLFKPTEGLQISRGNLAQLQTAFITWINQMHTWNYFIAKKMDNDISTDELREITGSLVQDTITMMAAIDAFVKDKDVERFIKAIEHSFRQNQANNQAINKG